MFTGEEGDAMIDWMKDRIEGYVLTRGIRKATEVALVTVVGGLTASMSKPVVLAALEKLRAYGIAVAWDGKIFSLQVDMSMAVTAGVAFAGALLVNFIFRKKPEAQVIVASETKTSTGG
jgi:hypothetical protein